MICTRRFAPSSSKLITRCNSTSHSIFVGRLIVILAVGASSSTIGDHTIAATIVAPNVYAAAEAPHLAVGVFRGGNVDHTFQWIFPASDFTKVPLGSRITAIGFRINGASAGQRLSASFAQWNLQLSSSNNPSLTLSSVFDDNIGPDVVTVRSGPLTLTANSFPSGPNPNQFYDILFSTPYVYNGGELLMTLRHTAHSGPQSLIENDADAVASGYGNSVGVISGFTDSFGIAKFGNFPVTRFTYVPEPTGLLLGAAGVFVMSVSCRCVSRARP